MGIQVPLPASAPVCRSVTRATVNFISTALSLSTPPAFLPIQPAGPMVPQLPKLPPNTCLQVLELLPGGRVGRFLCPAWLLGISSQAGWSRTGQHHPLAGVCPFFAEPGSPMPAAWAWEDVTTPVGPSGLWFLTPGWPLVPQQPWLSWLGLWLAACLTGLAPV
jgi:hypothetical protein